MEVIEFAARRHELRKQRATQISLVITKIGKQRFCLLFDPGHVVTASLKHDAAMTKHVAHSITIVAVIYLVRYARSEEHTTELQSLMRISYAVFCLTKKLDIRTIGI